MKTLFEIEMGGHCSKPSGRVCCSSGLDNGCERIAGDCASHPCRARIVWRIAGLAYCVKVFHYKPGDRFLSRIPQEMITSHAEHFMDQFFRGANHPEMKEFAQYTYLDKKGKVVWPLCFVEAFFLMRQCELTCSHATDGIVVK